MGRYFGTDGVRGEAGVRLTGELAYRLGRFFGGYCARRAAYEDKRARILVGKDTRLSSYVLEYALSAGIAASGADACLLHVTTTPSLSYLAGTGDYAGGVMISASHNPYPDNGIKLFDASGEKLSESLEAEAEAYLDGEEPQFPHQTGDRLGKIMDAGGKRQAYLSHLLACVGGLDLSGRKIALDCANGSTWRFAPALFRSLGAAVTVLGDSPTGTNINLACGSTHPEALCRAVLREECDVGFAFDGDGDRCIAVDGEGRVVDGDGMLYLSACRMKARGELGSDGVVGTHMTNGGLEAALARQGIVLTRTDVGDRYVHERMKEGGYCLGGEPSGHLIFARHASTGDGMLTALLVCEAIAQEGLPLSRLVAGYRPRPQLTRSLRLASPAGILSHPRAREALAREGDVLAATGGRLLVRPSGTEPLLRIMCEGEDSRQLVQVADALQEVFLEIAKEEP